MPSVVLRLQSRTMSGVVYDERLRMQRRRKASSVGPGCDLDRRSDVANPIRSVHGSKGFLTIRLLPGITKALSPKPICRGKRQPRNQASYRQAHIDASIYSSRASRGGIGTFGQEARRIPCT